MEVKLKVLGGAKSGVEIPLKKEEFTIGRSSECSLRAGSDAISRKHCAIRVAGSTITIEDLKSRNGTFVNGERIEKETTLQSGDEVRVGPLRFQVLAEHGLDTRKRPHVTGIAEAAARVVGQADKSRTMDESIDNWLTEPASESQVMHETRSHRLDETQAGEVLVPHVDSRSDAGPTPAENVLDSGSEGTSDAAVESTEGSSIHKRKDKKEPGKLPTRPKGPATKDSREAAAEVLRAMTRRR